METLLATSTALLAGLLMTRVFKLIHLHFPDVTAFLLAGLLVGPYCLGRLGIPGLGFVSMEAVDSLDVLSNTALGFIAFAIGNEFRLSQLKATGKQATVIGIVQAITATVLVDLALVGLHFCFGENVLPLSAAITLGAIAAATAPAATLMVVRQYKAKGEVTDLLLPIVALDDAVGLIIFAVSFGIAGRRTECIRHHRQPDSEDHLLPDSWSGTRRSSHGTGKAVLLQLQPSVSFDCLCDADDFSVLAPDPPGSGRDILLLASGVHDAGNRVLQYERIFGRYHEPRGQMDSAPVRHVLRHQRRGAGAQRFPLSGSSSDRTCLYSDPVPGKICWGFLQQHDYGMQ